MLHFLWYIVIGFVVGVLARFFYPGAVHMGFLLTTLVGIAGAFVGGGIGHLFRRPAPGAPAHPPGLILSVIGAVVVLAVLLHF